MQPNKKFQSTLSNAMEKIGLKTIIDCLVFLVHEVV